MIRYPVSVRNLIIAIKHHEAQDWLKRARKRTEEFRRLGKYVEDDGALKPFWSDLTPLYLYWQENKCIYCERTLDDVVYGRVEMNVEHYRPKQKVNAWPSSYMRKKYPHLAHYSYERGGNLPLGYWSLAYHPFNLAVSCLRCNLRAKKNFFPIDASRVISDGRKLQVYHSESPDLFYPLSLIDSDDPEVCITFRGPFAFPAIPIPVRARQRARVTIDLLHLNQRSELIRERCRAICGVYAFFTMSLSQNVADRNAGKVGLVTATHNGAPHVNCARCFLRLCEQDIETARMIFFEAAKRISPQL